MSLVLSWLWKAFSLPVFLRNDTVVIGFAMLGTYFFHGMFNNFLNTDKFAFLFWGSLRFILSRMKYAK